MASASKTSFFQMTETIKALDAALSQRLISLDPSGYFLIRIDDLTKELIVEHFGNDLDDLGRAVDPETGEVLGCHDHQPRIPLRVYRGRSAKEVGILLTEGDGPYPVSRLDHALYLGRELQRAESCLLNATSYIQD